MSRRRRAEKREVMPDPKYGDLVVSKFTNNVMYHGKKSAAERIVYAAFDDIASKKRRSRFGRSTKLSTTSSRSWKCVHAVSAVPPIRCRLKCVPSALRRWPFAGLFEAARGRPENTMEERLVARTPGCRGKPRKCREET